MLVKGVAIPEKRAAGLREIVQNPKFMPEKAAYFALKLKSYKTPVCRTKKPIICSALCARSAL